MGIMNTIVWVVLLLLIVMAFVIAPKTMFSATYKIGKAFFTFVKEVITETKPVVKEISTKLNESKTKEK